MLYLSLAYKYAYLLILSTLLHGKLGNEECVFFVFSFSCAYENTFQNIMIAYRSLIILFENWEKLREKIIKG